MKKCHIKLATLLWGYYKELKYIAILILGFGIIIKRKKR